MRTTKRIATKRAKLFSAEVLTLPMTLDHAKPSLWRLPMGTARLYVYQTAVRELAGVGRRRYVKRAVWAYFAGLSSPSPEGA